MEIELNTNRAPSVPPTPPPPRVRPAAAAEDEEAKFSGAAALADALARLPDTRSEMVHKSREVVGSVKYPPDETLNRIARLLAMQLPDPTE
jgi:hypothetical protein